MGDGVVIDLSGKTALVTGGTHGIGASTALSLATAGCRVVVFSRDVEKVDNIRKIFQSLHLDATCLVGDVCDAADFERITTQITEEFGGVDILINNAGGGGRWGSECILETDENVWTEVYEKNVTAAMRYTKFFLPYMINKNWGRVVTISSIYGKEVGGRPWFNIAKTAQAVLMKNLSQNKSYSSHNITFNCVAPGPIYIPNTGWSKLREEKPREFNHHVQKIPRQRLGTPVEVANVVTFLSSDLSSLINGAVIACDGGQGVCL